MPYILMHISQVYKMLEMISPGQERKTIELEGSHNGKKEAHSEMSKSVY